jgi:hypothetical protein
LTQLFGFTQLDFAGSLVVADGRYLARDELGERVLVIETLAASPGRLRRRRARESRAETAPPALPLSRVTVVHAHEPFADQAAAAAWLERLRSDEASLDDAIAVGTTLINRALHAHAVASGEPLVQTVAPERTVAMRAGYGSGEEVAEGEFSAALEVDSASSPKSRRQRRDAELRPQERFAAIFGGREQGDACETLLLRTRADLDAGRRREAALQLRVGLEALLVELENVLSDPDHVEDMAVLRERRQEAGELANQALRGDLDPDQVAALRDLLERSERVIRRRRVLHG